MSFMNRALTSSHILLNVSASVGFLFMSYFWYQNGRSANQARIDRLERNRCYQSMLENYRFGCENVNNTSDNSSDNNVTVQVPHPSE